MFHQSCYPPPANSFSLNASSSSKPPTSPSPIHHISLNHDGRSGKKPLNDKTQTYISCKRNKILQDRIMTSKEKKQSLLNINKKRRMILSKSTRNDTRDINMYYGNRTLQITSMNTDTVRTRESISTLILNLEANKVDVECIQETQ